MKGDPNPNEEEVKIVIERDEDFSFVLEIIEVGKASPVYNEKLLAITANTALESIRTRLKTAEARAEIAEAERDQLRIMFDELSRTLEELSKSEITKWRKLQAEILYMPSGRNQPVKE